jgi:Tol biopolymer transport system component
MKNTGALVIAAVIVAAGPPFATVHAQPGTTERVSVSSAGVEGNHDSGLGGLAISAGGRYVLFHSRASNLVAGDTNELLDVFVHDRATGMTERISVSSAGVEANDNCWCGSISANGRYADFYSGARSLVPGDTNDEPDVFLRDRLTGTTERISVSTAGEQANDISSVGAMSPDGRYVAFRSLASNLVPGDTNSRWDVFVRDRGTGTTVRVSLSSTGEQGDGNSGLHPLGISPDGRYIVFDSDATNLVPGDTNGVADVFVRDQLAGTTERVSVSSAGGEATERSGYYSVAMSADARYIAFDSDAPDLVAGDTNGFRDVFLRDRLGGTTARVSVSSAGAEGDDHSGSRVQVTADGQYVIYDSNATNLIPDDTNERTDVFAWDLLTHTTERVSVSFAGEQGNGWSATPSTSLCGLYVAFSAYASNLVPDDTNSKCDVFVHECEDAYVSVSGSVTFQFLDPGAAIAEWVGMRIGFEGLPLGEWTVPLDPDGFYSRSVPRGVLQLSVKHTHWLRRSLAADTTSGNVTGLCFDLLNGDANDDNCVDLVDLSRILLHFDACHPMSDLNEDGNVDLLDLNQVFVNFGRWGDP